MKKILKAGVIALAVVALAGCSFGKSIEDKNVDVNKQISKATKSSTIDNLQTVDTNILLTSIGLEAKEVKDFIGKIPMYNRPEGTLYIAVKPTKGNEDRVEEALESYIKSLKLKLDVTNPTANEDEKKEENTANKKELEYLNNITKETHKGYFIYVNGAKKDEILKILKQRVK